MDIQSAIKDLLDKINSIERRLNAIGGGAGQANTASNIGVGGVGLYQQKVGVDLQFRNINAGSAIITVALDAPNNEVDIDVDPSQIDLNDLGDVNAGAPANNDLLTWNTATARWIAQAGAAGGAENYFAHRKSERYYTHWDNYGMTTTWLTINYIWAIPFIVPVQQNFDRIALRVTGAAAGRVMRLGIYEDDGDVYPGDLVHGTAELDNSTTGCKEENINETLDPGLYWLAVLAGGPSSTGVRALYYQYSAHCVIGRTACDDLVPPCAYTGAQAYGAMPDPFPGGIGETDTTIPAIMLRKS